MKWPDSWAKLGFATRALLIFGNGCNGKEEIIVLLIHLVVLDTRSSRHGMFIELGGIAKFCQSCIRLIISKGCPYCTINGATIPEQKGPVDVALCMTMCYQRRNHLNK